MAIVECSTNWCKFKNNNGYYGVCKNPKTHKQYREFGDGHVQVSGCACSGCESDCGIIPQEPV